MDVWADETALYIWSGDAVADLSPLRAAKAELGIEGMVKPVGVPRPDHLVRLPQGCDRILAIGIPSPWVCDYILIGEKAPQEEWRNALAWCLHVVDDEPRAVSVDDIMRSVWPNAREMTAEELEGEQLFHDYVNGIS